MDLDEEEATDEEQDGVLAVDSAEAWASASVVPPHPGRTWEEVGADCHGAATSRVVLALRRPGLTSRRSTARNRLFRGMHPFLPR